MGLLGRRAFTRSIFPFLVSSSEIDIDHFSLALCLRFLRPSSKVLAGFCGRCFIVKLVQNWDLDPFLCFQRHSLPRKLSAGTSSLLAWPKYLFVKSGEHKTDVLLSVSK